MLVVAAVEQEATRQMLAALEALAVEVLVVAKLQVVVPQEQQILVVAVVAVM
jgi:hypothetical protein